MSLSPQEEADRCEWMGASDSPGIIGVDRPPYPNAHCVFLAKRYGLEPMKTNEAIEIGDDFEAPLLAWAARELGVQIVPVASRRHPDDPIMAAKPDGIIPGTRQGAEAKTTSGGRWGADGPVEWGEEGSDVVPDRVTIQAQHQMYVWDLDTIWVPVLLARFDRLKRVLYRVDRHEELIKLIVERDHAFWENHVLPGLPPPGMLPSFDIVRRIKRIPDKIEAVEPSVALAYIDARQVRLEAERAEEKAKSALFATDAEAYEWGDPERIITYFQCSRKGYSVAPSTFRMPRIAKR